MAKDWSYFDKFEEVSDKYLPPVGEGETMATQIVTAVNKLVYKWYNDGDVFDNTGCLTGWYNDLSSYANWLDEYTSVDYILEKIAFCDTGSDYEDLLAELADALLNEEYLAEQNKIGKTGTIYECDGRFEFKEYEEEEEEENWHDEEEGYYSPDDEDKIYDYDEEYYDDEEYFD